MILSPATFAHNNKNILAIDPGGTTGIATHTSSGYTTLITKNDEALFDLILKTTWDIVIVENFVAQLIGHDGLATVRLVGAVQALCYARNIKCIVQMPNDRTWMIRNGTVAKFIRPHSVIHERDALAHLLNWEAKNSSL